jgi:hypothetical protein
MTFSVVDNPELRITALLLTAAGKLIIETVNYRSLHLNLFEDVDRYAPPLSKC